MKVLPPIILAAFVAINLPFATRTLEPDGESLTLGVAGVAMTPQDGASNPPDPSGAIGPEHIVATANWSVGLFNRKMQRIARSDARQFYTGAKGDSFDQRCLFHEAAKRFFICGLAPDPQGEFSLTVNLSKSDKPATLTPADWQTVFIGGAVDFPMVGCTADGYLISFGTPEWRLLRIRHNLQSDWITIPGKNGASPMVSVSPGTPGGPAFLCQLKDSNRSALRITRVSEPFGACTFGMSVDVPVKPRKAPEWTKQPGGPLNHWHYGSLTTRVVGDRTLLAYCETQADPAGKPLVCWYLVDVSDSPPRLIEEGAVDGFNSSLAMNGRGDLGITFNRSSNTDFIGMLVGGRQLGGASGQFVCTSAKTSTVNSNTAAPAYRWGDYSAVAVDPLTGGFAAFNEIAAQETMRNYNWQTYCQQFAVGHWFNIAGRMDAVIDGKAALIDFTGKGQWK